jgi:hypothetical protein
VFGTSTKDESPFIGETATQVPAYRPIILARNNGCPTTGYGEESYIISECKGNGIVYFRDLASLEIIAFMDA